jgi:signal transduction histidine kinase
MIDDHTLSISEDDKDQFLRLISIESKNLNALLENLLTWARTQTEDISYHPTVLDLHIIVQRNIDLFRQRATSKGITINSNIMPGTQIYGDRNMIALAIRNLISNAVKFTDKGHIYLDHKLLQKSDLIEVKDTGVGMTKEQIDNLFQIDKSHSTRGTEMEKGTGLGLLLCKEFIERHGGEISVTSLPNYGSTFRLLLPHKR